MKNTFAAWMNKAMIAGLITTAFALPLNAQTDANVEQLTALAARATTPAQHAEVAERFRSQAETFAAQAAEHEKKAKQQMRSVNSSSQKFHGLSSRSVQEHKAKAVEARRAALETMALADHHMRMSVAVAVARQ
jgi:DNA anti-recombination protein RmuC